VRIWFVPQAPPCFRLSKTVSGVHIAAARADSCCWSAGSKVAFVDTVKAGGAAESRHTSSAAREGLFSIGHRGRRCRRSREGHGHPPRLLPRADRALQRPRHIRFVDPLPVSVTGKAQKRGDVCKAGQTLQRQPCNVPGRRCAERKRLNP